MKPRKGVMLMLAATLLAAALKRLSVWWREADLLQFWKVLMWLTLTAIGAAGAIVYAFF